MNKFWFRNRKTAFLWSNLLFSLLLLGCKEGKKEAGDITIQWKEEKAEAVLIPLQLFSNIVPDSPSEHVQVRLINSSVPIIHEEIKHTPGAVLFKPLLPFTHGLGYEVFYLNKFIGQFEIPPLKTEDYTEVLAVYPSSDTIPENSLKLYVVFSSSMQEGEALHNIRFIKNERDTVPVFLDLDQELWNKERTVLTLWFDPGRIKRDLQPNINLGTPLQENNRYKMIIDKSWRDSRGLEIKSNFEKTFFVGKKDSISPDPSAWGVSSLKASTKDALRINLHEPLDYFLLKTAVYITDKNGHILPGEFEPSSKERNLLFIPSIAWESGVYSLHVESRLEDLAGNNLNRLFDKDLSRPDKSKPRTEYTIKFGVN